MVVTRRGSNTSLVENSAIENLYVGPIASAVNYLSHDLPPGPKCLQVRHIVNFQKGGTSLYILYLMFHFNNFSMTAYTYLALHGTYGILWLLKDQIFPDLNWAKPCTVLSSVASFLSVLGPYWIAGYLTVAGNVECTPPVLAFTVFWHTLGCILMMCADTQKYYTLKYKKGLITEGWFARCRNTNYLGEMMLYSSYAILSQSWVPWLVYAYVWTVLFGKNMTMKEISLRKKAGWADYQARSWFVIPGLW